MTFFLLRSTKVGRDSPQVLHMALGDGSDGLSHTAQDEEGQPNNKGHDRFWTIILLTFLIPL